MWETINHFLGVVDNFVWGVPLMVLIMAGGILLTVRLGLLADTEASAGAQMDGKKRRRRRRVRFQALVRLCTALECHDRYRKYRRCGNCGL